ncbi:hypothetical protein NITHO_4000001 [Nitrolancea hollandica Lb]|uniref:Uncharacterized protein n=1 Tax=Nitrolancea hollandica Lb TaxID=1129897 RepID=I4EJF7_9BACT|nr:hypothetical protein NITHO_4000001 [Nitrolancea hollandica Lb]
MFRFASPCGTPQARLTARWGRLILSLSPSLKPSFSAHREQPGTAVRNPPFGWAGAAQPGAYRSILTGTEAAPLFPS